MKPHLPAALAAAALSVPAGAQYVLESHQVIHCDDGAITPDGTLGIVRQLGAATTTRFYDMNTGAMLGSYTCASAVVAGAGPSEDSVAATDERALVMNSCADIFDLTQPGFPVLGEHPVGNSARDVAITPDGSIAAVRGGDEGVGYQGGGLYLFDLTTGAVLVNVPGFAPSTSVDSVVATDDYAVFLSRMPMRTRVTIFELRPSGGGAPQIAYDTQMAGPDGHQAGLPQDLTLTRDGRHVAVRSDYSVSLYRLAGGPVGRVWDRRLLANPGPLGGAAMDSIDATDEWIATVSRDTNGAIGAQIDVFDLAGNQSVDSIAGDPHDLVLTPNGEKLVVRTSAGVFLYDLTNVPSGGSIPSVDQRPLNSSNTSFAAGLDSLDATDDFVVALARLGALTQIRIYDIEGNTLEQRVTGTITDEPVDVEITPDGTKAAIVGQVAVRVYDLRTGQVLLDEQPFIGSGHWPWSDGIAIDDDSLLAFGYVNLADVGWVSVIDLFDDPVRYCVAAANSVGLGASLAATGSARVSANDLDLVATGLPPRQVGQFVYGGQQTSTAFGDGFLCITGQAFRFPFERSDADGVAQRAVDYTGPDRLGGAVTVGSTWNFQYLYRDPAGPGGNGFNASDAVEILFGM